MARRLPPLNALKAFEAAARHLSFLKAADELRVTPGAVSQQVKALEAQLGLALFRRLPRGLLLTDAGQRYGKRLDTLFDGIEAATRELARDEAAGVLTVSAMPSFAARWLIPRLGAFTLAHPEINLRVLAETGFTDFANTDVDLAIRYGPRRDPGLTAELLFPRTVFPVCSPKLMAGSHPIRSLADLAHHTLLHDEPYPGYEDFDWTRWLAAVGARNIDARRGPVFVFTHMSLQAAAEGQGVALGTTVLAGDDIAAGRLVRPLPHEIKSNNAYWLLCPPAMAERRKLRAFHDWIMAEVHRFNETTA
ncbi:MAG TPA: transcriptional regulator GcvA [Alphaproteobacteria bacterium]|nr:transcriptional regulator GcvA [Alphaproteobacteria bacterium]